MSEEVVIVSEVQSGTFFVLTLDSTVALLDKENARGLRDDLNKFLGADKVQGQNTIGIVFPKGVPEPDLPVGTRLRDNEGDIAARMDDGWAWVELFGDVINRPTSYTWEEIQDAVAHKEFTVIA